MATTTIPAIRRFRLLPERLPAAERRVRNRQLIPYVAIFTAFILASTFMGFRRQANVGTTLVVLVIIALFLTYVFFAVPRRVRKRVTSFWSSYTLEIGPDYLLRQVADTPDVRLSFSEVRSIERRQGESLRLIGANPLHVIYIPPGIEHFDEVWQGVAAGAGDRPCRQSRTTGKFSDGRRCRRIFGNALVKIGSNRIYNRRCPGVSPGLEDRILLAKPERPSSGKACDLELPFRYFDCGMERGGDDLSASRAVGVRD